jgi:hypothetical protein
MTNKKRLMIIAFGAVPATVFMPVAWLGLLVGFDGAIHDYDPIPNSFGFLSRADGLYILVLSAGGILGTVSLWLAAFLNPSKMIGYGLIAGVLAALTSLESPLLVGPLIVGVTLAYEYVWLSRFKVSQDNM